MELTDLFEDEGYRGEHQAPMKGDGAPLHDVTQGIYPADFYSPNGYRYYAENGEPGASEAFGIVTRAHGHPNRPIRIYRAVPKGQGFKINPGDWVTITRRYATDHGRTNLNNNYSVTSKLVFARDLFTDGNSICEWGYDPQPFDHAAEQAKRQRRLEKFLARIGERNQ
jgi:hypothetical protein